MKPRVFIGSSTRSLPIAYAIQENLQYDCNSTVWSQGIFQLSSNTLDALVKALEEFDFAVFVFHSDDIIKLKDSDVATVRDNIIFELGLFIGKLGKDRVYFVKPKNTELKIPSDLLGITHGIFDEDRPDGNLKAALGPFCNQIRDMLSNFVYVNLNDLEGESNKAKKIAIEQPSCWEYLLAAELLDTRLKPINESYIELEKGLVFQTTKVLDFEQARIWFSGASEDLRNLINLFSELLNKELETAFGPPGVAGNIIEIKNVCDRFRTLGKELIAWEYRLRSVKLEPPFDQIKHLMAGWTRPIFDEINTLPHKLRTIIGIYLTGTSITEHRIKLTLGPPQNIDKILELINQYSQE